MPQPTAHEPGAAGPAGSGPPATPSTRVRLARIARDVALATEGVADATAGRLGLHVTAAGLERLPGVVVTSLPNGRYGVELHLVGRAVPLHPLGDVIREQIRTAASAAGLETALGPVDITFEDLEEEAAADAAASAGAG